MPASSSNRSKTGTLEVGERDHEESRRREEDRLEVGTVDQVPATASLVVGSDAPARGVCVEAAQSRHRTKAATAGLEGTNRGAEQEAVGTVSADRIRASARLRQRVSVRMRADKDPTTSSSV